MTTQVSLVRAHLEASKPITPMQAIAVYGIFRLSSVIEDLRQVGVDIDCVLKWDEMGKQYGEYRLRRPIQAGSLVQVKRGHGVGLPRWALSLKKSMVVTSRPAGGNLSGGIGACLVRFIRGRNIAELWLNERELVNAE